jgi:outer membrane protein
MVSAVFLKRSWAAAAVLVLGTFLRADILSAQQAVPPAEMTLDDAFRLARRRAESLQIRMEEIERAEARYRQAFGAALPKLRFHASTLIQDTGGRASSDVGSTLTRRERPEAKFTIRQPLFSGFREFAAMTAFRSESEAERHRLDRALRLLYLDVARAFYLALSLESDLSNLDRLLSLTRERIGELEERARLGKSRRSEVLRVESQAAALEAQRSLLDGQRRAARDLLSFLTDADLASARLSDVTPAPEQPADPEILLARAENRSDLLALRRDEDAARQRVKLSKGLLYPSAGVLGNYYTHRVGTQREIDWDVLLSLDVPLYQGGATRAQVREARSARRQAELRLQERRREVRLEVRDARTELVSTLERIENLRVAHEKAEESYRLHSREYRLGLVNNLEVLEAMNAMQERKSELDRAVLEGKLNRVELKVATEDVEIP